MARMPKVGSITSPFGMRKHPITGVTRMHNGVDIGGGGTIVAPVALVITHKGQNLDKNVGYGYWIMGRDGNGKTHTFAHMAAPSTLNVGNSVPEGGIIGQAGATGGATGVHLHWGVSNGVETGWIDPIAYINSLVTPPTNPNAGNPDVIDRVAREVIAGKWGNGEDRKRRLAASGFDYATVQARVNALLNTGSPVVRTYTVQRGDSLSGIANRLGYPGGWRALWERNRGIIGNNPNVIYAGQVLTL